MFFQLIDYNRIGNINSRINKGVAYDSNDIARKTIKETAIHDNRTGNMGVLERGIAYDEMDTAILFIDIN